MIQAVTVVGDHRLMNNARKKGPRTIWIIVQSKDLQAKVTPANKATCISRPCVLLLNNKTPRSSHVLEEHSAQIPVSLIHSFNCIA